MVLLERNGERLSLCNETAALLWDALAAGGSAADLAATLVRTFGIDAARAREDVIAALSHWQAEGHVARAGESGERRACEAPQAPIALDGQTTWAVALGRRRVAITADPTTAARLRPWLAHLETGRPGTDGSIRVARLAEGGTLLAVDGRERLRTTDAGLILGGVYQAVIEAAHPGTDWLAWIHGGAVARGGRALILAAPSGSGKSTLIAHLVGRGLHLLTDDLIALAAPRGEVVPWPMPVSIKPGAWAVLRESVPGLDAAPIQTHRGKTERLFLPGPEAWASAPAPVAAICFPRFVPDAPASLAPLRPIAALQRLIEDRCHFGHPLAVERVRAFLDWLAETPAYALDYGDLGEAGACVDRVLAR